MVNRKKAIVLGIVLIVIVAAFAVMYQLFIPKGFAGEKPITIAVDVYPTGDDYFYSKTIQTNTDTLGDALRQDNAIAGIETDFGFYITAVDGVEADESKQQWWCITKGGEEVFTGVDDTPIANEETYELTLKTGY